MWRQSKPVDVPAAGEVWAYRARALDELVPVLVLKHGARRPSRVLVRFEQPTMEGREEWVPPARLKVRWDDVDAFRAEEARWEAVAALSPAQESVEVIAAEEICEDLIPEDVASFGYKDAHLEVHDVAALAGLVGVDQAFIAGHPAGFRVDDGPLIVPWPVAVEIVKRALAGSPEPVLAKVERDEAEARYKAIHGEWFTSGGRDRHEYYIEPDRCAQYDEESPWGAAKRALLRRWAGGAVDRWDELVELRKEIRRVGQVAEAAIASLRQHGHTREAERLSTELGMTVQMLRRSPD